MKIEMIKKWDFINFSWVEINFEGNIMVNWLKNRIFVLDKILICFYYLNN